MLLIIFVIVLQLECATVHGDYDYSPQTCRDYLDNVYVVEGQVVEWSNSVQGRGWMEPCVNKTLVENTNSSMIRSLIVEYAYEQLDVLHTFLPTMPKEAATKTVYIRGVTPLGVWGGCSRLETLEIAAPLNLTLTPSDWLANCTKLYSFILEGLTVKQIIFILNSVPRPGSIQFREIVDIENIVWDPVFPLSSGGHEWITRIDYTLSRIKNEIPKNYTWSEISEAFVYQLSLLPNLDEILIYSFSTLDWCASVNYSSVTFESLKDLTLPNSATTSACFRELRLAPKLKSLTYVASRIKFSELSPSCAPQLRVLLYGNSDEFYREDYLKLYDCTEPEKSNVTLNMFEAPIDCDCSQSLWLARAQMSGFLTIPGSTCSDGTELEYQTCDWLNCTRVVCNTPCVCCDDTNYGIVADCRDAHLSAVPNNVMLLDNLTELLIPNNNVSKLPNRFPESLNFADFYGNDLFQHMDASEITALFVAKDRIVRLAANPIICVCDNQLLIQELQRFSNQIEDYEQIVCAGQDTKLNVVDAVSLCAARDHDVFVLVVVVMALVVAITALMLGITLYYRREIQIFLFARGWCLGCINEEELDADRRYDVFISFCYADEQIVCNEIVAKLDQEYAVCVHYRDWNPGDMIPAQIWTSVEQSRRTLVVLSRNFVKSLWGLLEFRSAYISGLNDGRVRVVMVVLDDVLESQDLELELRAYIKLNTYVKWGDPWFWDKLRFALPHRPASFKPDRRSSDIGDANYLVSEPPVEMLAIDGTENNGSEEEIIDGAENNGFEEDIIGGAENNGFEEDIIGGAENNGFEEEIVVSRAVANIPES
ncbi:hypothetical protein O0L34_g9281 [Tuta absoluta]|nr:hypothetical protein O0L34_g9281 [Tuta absoluta]